VFLFFFCLLGGRILRVLCLRFVDFKVLIAYSSVAHISLVIRRIISERRLGAWRALGISLGHGIVSSGIFFGAGLFYGASQSRLFLFNKGTMNWAPWFAFFWFILCRSNIGTPPRFNFWIELFILFRLVSYRRISLFLLGVALFFGVVFNIILYLLSQSQKPSYGRGFFLLLNHKDYLIFIIHICMRVFLIFTLFFRWSFKKHFVVTKKIRQVT